MNVTANFNRDRVTFDQPTQGFTLEQLEVLEMAIRHARTILSEKQERELSQQTDLRAAPS